MKFSSNDGLLFSRFITFYFYFQVQNGVVAKIGCSWKIIRVNKTGGVYGSRELPPVTILDSKKEATVMLIRYELITRNLFSGKF